MGRKSRIDRATFKDVELFDPARDDLRNSPHRARIEQLLEGRVLDSYHDTAVAYGYDLRRFYSADAGERALTLCIYCSAELPASADACPVCVQPAGRDAPVNTTVNQLTTLERKPCKHCKAPIIKTAVICRWCKTRR